MQAVMSLSLPNFGRFCLAVVFCGAFDLADAASNVKFTGNAKFTGRDFALPSSVPSVYIGCHIRFGNLS
jgi:hypothetical protein